MILYITNFITVYIHLTIKDYIPFKFVLQLIHLPFGNHNSNHCLFNSTIVQ